MHKRKNIPSSSPSISVVMPCYNAESTVERAIESIRSQTLENWELIIIDDGSTDRSGEVIEKIATGDSRITLLREAHKGVVGASLAGFRASRGDLIARMDADDESLPTRLAEQHLVLEESPDLDAVSCLVNFAGDPELAGGYAHHVDWTNQLRTPEQIALNRFVDLPVPHPTLMYRRSTIERFGGYRDGDFPEDYEMILRWIDGGAKIGKVAKVLFNWHDPPTRLSRNNPRYAMSAFHQCKAPLLANAICRSGCGARKLWIWGAGRPARKCAAPLEAGFKSAVGFIDVDPRKVGRTLHGRPVVDSEHLPPQSTSVIVAYVASRGAGQKIRATLIAKGRIEGIDFWIAA